MKKRTLIKRVGVLAMLCALTMTMVAEPAFADAKPYQLVVDGVPKTVSGKRIDSCKHMEKMSISAWTIDKQLTYQRTATGSTTTLNPGAYIGVPYTQVAREHSYLGNDTINLNFDDDGVTLHGTDCSSSVDFAWRKGIGQVGNFMRTSNSAKELYRTKHMFNDGLVGQKETGTSGDYLKLVGRYGTLTNDARRNMTSTEQMIKALRSGNYYEDGKDIYSEIYADMKPGDALIKRGTDSTSGHVRLVMGVEIKYMDETDANGRRKVDPKASTVYCVEQAGFREGNSNWTTSWMPNTLDGSKYNGVYTFEQLAGVATSYNLKGDSIHAYYLPIEPRAFND